MKIFTLISNNILLGCRYISSEVRCQKFECILNYPNKYRIFLKLAMATNRYCIDLAKRGTAGCKNCNKKIDKGIVRIAKIVSNPFTDNGGDMKQWFHVRCIFDKLSRARATTKKIESIDDLEGWDDLDDEHKPEVLKCLADFSSSLSTKKTPQRKKQDKSAKKSPSEEDDSVQDDEPPPTKDDSFYKFQRVCKKIADHPKYTEKTAIFSDFFSHGTDGEAFNGNLYLWVKMLLPAVEKRIYNLQTTQLIKIFSKIFDVSSEEMLEDFEKGVGKGDISETIKEFFQKSNTFSPAKESTLYLQEVDKCLDQLTQTGLEVDQIQILTKFGKRCTGKDLKFFIRLIKHDLRMNAGPKHILEAIHPSAYEAFQASRDLKAIVNRSMKLGKKGNLKENLDVKSTLMTPVLPMLAMACKDLEMPFKKCPKGFYVEVKYDGERVQIHKKGKEFSYFSRSLKPVMPHKVNHFKDFIPKAFPFGNDLMLDCEILLVDKKGTPLPFGTLGAHKKSEFQEATVCLYVFDCLQFNDQNIMKNTLVERRKILEDNMQPIKNHIMFSELKEIKSRKDLDAIVSSVIDQGLEGLVIKAKDGVYEPGKRHWLKLKKDYLKKDGKSMADSADLVVLGGYYGTGRKGGIMSVFLMGCYDEYSRKWCTVTKVPGGDDATLEELQGSLEMKKISKDPLQVPSWLNINKAMIPDFVTKNPKESPVWEISGAEFGKSDRHTASGISIRFPRIAKVRDDKTWKTATSLGELKDLYDASKTKTELIGLKMADDESDDDDAHPMGMSSASVSSSEKTPKKKLADSHSSSSKKAKKNIEEFFPSSQAPEEAPPNKTQSKKLKKETEEMAVKKIKLDVSSEGSVESKPKKSKLVNVFTGVKMHIPESVADYEKLRRYFVAYDGDLLQESECENATHVIVPIDDSLRSRFKNVIRISGDWLWDSIKLRKRLCIDPYKP